MIKDIFAGLSLYLVSLLLILLYCLIVYAVGSGFWGDKASGSLIVDKEHNIRGSLLLAQALPLDKYFQPRTTEKVDTICDVALYNDKLRGALLARFEEAGQPYDISSITPSASLLDPYITKREALSQASRVASARDIPFLTVLKIINSISLGKAEPFFEVEIVNTTILNIMLDEAEFGVL